MSSPLLVIKTNCHFIFYPPVLLESKLREQGKKYSVSISYYDNKQPPQNKIWKIKEERGGGGKKS